MIKKIVGKMLKERNNRSGKQKPNTLQAKILKLTRN